MARTQTISGELRQYDRPDWEPLFDLIGRELVEWFMWMNEVELADGLRVHAYKHVATRRYLHLTAAGRAFAYTGSGRYREISPVAAIDEAFTGWDDLAPEPSDPAAVRAALRRARAAAAEP